MNPNPKNVVFTKRAVINVAIFAIVGLAVLTIIRANSGTVSVEPTNQTGDTTAYNNDFYLFEGQGTTTGGGSTGGGTPAEGKYTAEQIADSTMGSGPPYNPSAGAPWGLHDRPIKVADFFDFKRGPRPASWQRIGQPGLNHIEWRCGVFAVDGTTPAGNVTVQVRNSAYYTWDGSWNSNTFNVNLETNGATTTRGAYHWTTDGSAGNPWDSATNSTEGIDWDRVGDGVFQAPWKHTQLMHFWAGQRFFVPTSVKAELLTAEIRLVATNGGTLDLQKNQLLGQCAPDYYQAPGHNTDKAPGPGIGKYHLLDGDWTPTLWVSTPPGTPTTFDATVNWLEQNPPPVLDRS